VFDGQIALNINSCFGTCRPVSHAVIMIDWFNLQPKSTPRVQTFTKTDHIKHLIADR